jgi:inner membrane protein
MMWKTHLVFGFLVGLFLIPFLKPAYPFVFLAIVLFTSLLPDVDHPDSKYGRKVKWLSFVFKHRGVFHSIFGVALFVVPFWYFGLEIIWIPVLVGYVSHLVGDMVTLQGIRPFYPFKLTISGTLRVNSWTETFFLIVFVLLAGWRVYVLWF